MDALEFRIERAINSIIRNTFPGKEIPKLNLKFMKQDTRSFHGDYYFKTQTARVGNLTRPPSHVVITLLHEAAHHCEFCMTGQSGHQKSFYVIYHALMTTAIRMGMFTYETAKTVTDSTSIRQLERYMGPITIKPDPDKKYKKGKLLVSVYNCYDIREILKNRGYYYNMKAKSWEKEIRDSEKQAEQAFLDNFPDATVVITDDFMTIIVMATITVTGNTYPCKDVLKSLNFKYRKKTPSGDAGGWYKIIQSTKVREYKNALKILSTYPGVVVSINY